MKKLLKRDRILFSGFANYKREYIKKDFLVAIVITAITIPQSLGFAAIAGLPIQTGLYCSLFAPVIFAIFTSSRYLIVGADSATAAIVASGATAIAVAGSPEYPSAIALLGLLTGLILLAMSILRLGFLADLISKPVLVGFLAGVGLQLIISQMPSMIGINFNGDIIASLNMLVSNLDNINWLSLIFSLFVLVIVVIANKRRLPGELIGLVIAVLAMKIANLERFGISVVGKIPSGLPTVSIPDLSIENIAVIFTSALVIATVILAQSLATIRSSAEKHDDITNDNKDLAALGFANIISSLTQGFAINGSPPRTLTAEIMGGKSQMVNIFVSAIMAMVLIFTADILSYIPNAALAAIICSIGFRLFDFSRLRDIWHTHKIEFLIAMVALVSVAILGVQKGIVIAVFFSLVERLRREYRPEDGILLRDQKISEWAATRIQGNHRDITSPEGVLIYRFGSDIFFENADYFIRRIKQSIDGAKKPVNTLILDAGAISDIDYTGAEALKKIAARCMGDNIKFSIAHVSPGLQVLFDNYGVTEIVGSDFIYQSLREAVRSQPGTRRPVVEMVKSLGLNINDYVVIGGGVLEVLDLRQTVDVDLVVSKSIYGKFKDLGWKEYIQDDGKKILSKRGYKIMMHYMRRDLRRLTKYSFIKNGVRFMGINDLIESKECLGRSKDLEDIDLLNKYLKSKST